MKIKIVTIQWKKVKSLRYDRWLIYKQPCQESSLCCFSFARYLQKCVTQIYRALYGSAMFVSFWGTQTWRPESNRNICHWVLLLKRKIIALELRHIKRNVSSSASTVQLTETKVITHLLTYATAFSGRNFHVTQRKSLEIQTRSAQDSGKLQYNKKNTVELKHCETSSSYRVFYLIKLKPRKER